MKKTIVLIGICLAFCFVTARAQTDWYVDQNYLGSVSDGGILTPFTTINDATSIAADQDVIHVQPGIYTDDFGWFGKTLSLVSTQGAEVTTIGCLVAFWGGGLSGQDEIDGFTFGYPQTTGVHIECFEMFTIFRNCSFFGLDINLLGNIQHLDFINCLLDSTYLIGLTGGYGSGTGYLTLVDCELRNHHKWDTETGGIPFDLGFIEAPLGGLKMIRCFVHDGNSLLRAASLTYCEIKNCVFADSLACVGLNAQSGTYISRSTLWNAPISSYNVIRMTNSIVWSSATTPSIAGSVEIQKSNVRGGYPSNYGANIDVDPLLVDPQNLDFHLQPGSPMINIGDWFEIRPWFYGMETDIDGEPCPMDRYNDMGADEFNSGLMPLSGTGDDLQLLAEVNGQRVTGPSTVVYPGDSVVVDLGASRFYSFPWIFGQGTNQSFATEPHLGHSSIHIDLNVADLLFDGPNYNVYAQSTPNGYAEFWEFNVTIPAGLSGLTYRVQAFQLAAMAKNGWYKASDAMDFIHP